MPFFFCCCCSRLETPVIYPELLSSVFDRSRKNVEVDHCRPVRCNSQHAASNTLSISKPFFQHLCTVGHVV